MDNAIFLTVAQTMWLTGKHTIFGGVIEGQDVVDQVTKVPTENDRPATDVVLNKVTILRVLPTPTGR